MYDHSSAVFNNSCLKVPRNPTSNQPSPVYEQKYLNQLKNQATKLSLEKDMRGKRLSSDSDKDIIHSLVEFYDSIPEYDDVNHLPAKEFYRRLEYLKQKQKEYHERLKNEMKFETKSTSWVDDYKNLDTGDRKSKISHLDDLDSVDAYEKEISIQPPSRRSVRIETPSTTKGSLETPTTSKSRANVSSAGSKGVGSCSKASAWDDLSLEDLRLDLDKELHLETKSAPSSPTRSKTAVGWKDTITIPQPFQMTVR